MLKLLVSILILLMPLSLLAQRGTKGTALPEPEIFTAVPINFVYNKAAWTIKWVWSISFNGVSVDQCETKVTGSQAVTVGATFYPIRTIEMVIDQSHAQARTTLLHELLHVVTGPKFMCKNQSGHDAIYDITPGLLQLLRDNQDLVDWLTADTDEN